jgi:hypothetical protein
VPAPNRITVFERMVYWSDNTKQGILSVDKYEGKESIRTMYRLQD